MAGMDEDDDMKRELRRSQNALEDLQIRTVFSLVEQVQSDNDEDGLSGANLLFLSNKQVSPNPSLHLTRNNAQNLC